jgi:hypothetical protein
MKRKSRAILLLTAGAVCVAAALAMHLPALALVIFVVFGFSASSLLSTAGRLADALAPLKGRRVHVRVWDQEVLQLAAGEFQLDSVASIGAGLHLFLRSASGSRGRLKVAQPQMGNMSADLVEVRQAKYVSWNGHKIHPSADRPGAAVTIRRAA